MSKYAGRELTLSIGNSGAHEKQAVVLTGFAGVDDFKLTYGGNESAIITRGTNYTAAGIKAAIEAITGVTFTVTVSGVTDEGFLVTWDEPGVRTALSVTNPTGCTGVVGTLVEGTAGAAALIGQMTSCGPVGSSRGLIDASAYGDDWMDWVVGQQDGAEVEVGIAYDPADSGHQDLLDAYNDGVSEDFEMEHAEAGFHVGFPALVTDLKRGAEREGLLTMTVTLKILNPGVEDVV